jgi:glucosamine--fructose-6-phosphate aminotransferase (isomerizing)
MADVLRAEGEIAAVAAGFADMGSAVVLGRGFNYATAFEWALKLEELARVIAPPFSTADSVHGPLALASPRLAILAVVPGGVPLAGEWALLQGLQEGSGARVAAISNDAALLGEVGAAIPIPACPEWLSPLPAVVAAQLFSYHVAVARGFDPDAPPNIEKVTRTI